MARKSRIDASMALHHIIVRAIERRSIFVDTQDYQEFLEWMGNIIRDEIKSQNRRRVVARSRAVINIVAIDKVGISGADVARALKLNRL